MDSLGKFFSRFSSLGRVLYLHSSHAAWIVLVTSLFLTLLATLLSDRWVHTTAKGRFGFKVEEIADAITRRMHEQEAILYSGVGFMNASDDVTRSEWNVFVESLRLDTYAPGSQGYGFALLIDPADKAQYERAVREEGFPDFRIEPDGARDMYSASLFLEPFNERNRRAFGYDMWSNQTMRTAMRRAILTGKPALTGIVTLAQETETSIQNGFLMFVPIYRKGTTLGTYEQNLAALEGFVYSPFRVRDLMHGIVREKGSGVAFDIYDGNDIERQQRLYATHSENLAEQALFTDTRTLTVAGRAWTLRVASTDGFVTFAEAAQPVVVAIGGIIIDVLLFLTVTGLGRQRKSAQALADQMSDSYKTERDRAELAAQSEMKARKEAEESNTKLREANAELSRFASIIAHDLRAPLKRVEAYIEVLRDDHAKALDEEGREVMDRITYSTMRMRQMMSALQDYTRHGRQSLNLKTVVLNDVIEATIETLRPDIDQARLIIDVPPNTEVVAEDTLLQEVIFNLLNNALKFRSSETPKISIGYSEDEWGRAEISITDNGIGIPVDRTGRVFEMFARLHNEDEYDGTGVGLAVCKRIVEDFGGTVRVDTDYHPGTRMVFALTRPKSKSRDDGKAAAA